MGQRGIKVDGSAFLMACPSFWDCDVCVKSSWASGENADGLGFDGMRWAMGLVGLRSEGDGSRCFGIEGRWVSLIWGLRLVWGSRFHEGNMAHGSVFLVHWRPHVLLGALSCRAWAFETGHEVYGGQMITTWIDDA